MADLNKKGSLIFTYATVGAGKSAQLIEQIRRYRKTSDIVKVLVPEIGCLRDGVCVKSRNGELENALMLLTDVCPFEFLSGEPVDILLLDEAQFLSAKQVRGLCRLVDERGINVLAYGLRTDFKGNPFEGASYLMAWADSIRELPSASDLEPYEFATMNMISRNYALTHSDLKNTIQPGFHYIAVSRSMFDLNTRWEPKT